MLSILEVRKGIVPLVPRTRFDGSFAKGQGWLGLCWGVATREVHCSRALKMIHREQSKVLQSPDPRRTPLESRLSHLQMCWRDGSMFSAILPEASSLTASTHVVAHNCNSSPIRSDGLSWPPLGKQVVHRHTWSQNTQTHKKLNVKGNP